MAVSRQQSCYGCFEPAPLLCLHRGNNLFVAASSFLWLHKSSHNKLDASLRLHRANLVVAAPRLHQGKNPIVAVLIQSNRCGCIEVTVLLWLHGYSKLIVAASSKQPRCGCIDATILLWLHRGYNLVVSELSQPLHCGCIKTKIL